MRAPTNIRLKDVADSIQYGHTASAIQRQKCPKFLRITDIQEGRVDWDAVPSCDIVAEDIPKYRIRVRVSEDVDARYLAHFFQSPDYWQQIERGKRGIGQPNVNSKTLGQIEFPLPPLDEQRQIVAEIEKQFTRLETGVAALRSIQTKLKRYRAAVLKAACEGHLVPTEAELARKENRIYESAEILLQRILKERCEKWNGKGKYKEPVAPNAHELPKLSEGWTWASVEQLSTKVVDGVSQKAKLCAFRNSIRHRP